MPLILGVGLLSFAHGANDVGNVIGPLAAIVSTLSSDGDIASKVSMTLWALIVGAFRIAIGLALFGPKLITTIGEKIARLYSPRANCVALSSAITVLIATTLGLPVSSPHIAIDAIFGVGFLREFLDRAKRREKVAKAKYQQPRQVVRRRFVLSIATAWVITVPASALLSVTTYSVLAANF